MSSGIQLLPFLKKKIFSFTTQKKFNRISIRRLFIPFHFLLLGIKIKPNYVISCTHELLKMSFYIKLFTKAKIMYDVQENYYSNIIHTTVFPYILRFPIAFFVRMNEWISSFVIHHYLLAEECYLDEISFIKKENSTILENKFIPLGTKKNTDPLKDNHYIITGTLGEHYGNKRGCCLF